MYYDFLFKINKNTDSTDWLKATNDSVTVKEERSSFIEIIAPTISRIFYASTL